MAYEVINEKLKVEACRIGDLTEVLDILKYSYISEVPLEVIQSIFQEYDSWNMLCITSRGTSLM